MDLQGRVPLGVSWRTFCQSPLLASAPVTTFGTSEALQGIYSTGLEYTYNITSPTVTLQPTNHSLRAVILRVCGWFSSTAASMAVRGADKNRKHTTHSVSSQRTWERTTPKAHAQNKRARFINVEFEVEAGSVKWKCEMEVRSRSAQ